MLMKLRYSLFSLLFLFAIIAYIKLKVSCSISIQVIISYQLPYGLDNFTNFFFFFVYFVFGTGFWWFMLERERIHLIFCCTSSYQSESFLDIFKHTYPLVWTDVKRLTQCLEHLFTKFNWDHNII